MSGYVSNILIFHEKYTLKTSEIKTKQKPFLLEHDVSKKPHFLS